MRHAYLFVCFAALTFGVSACDDDGTTGGDESVMDAGIPAPTCDSVCNQNSECLVVDACVEACEAEEPANRDSRVACLHMADAADCESVFACLPEEPPEGACYFLCESGPLQGCSAGNGVTEEACTASGEMDCGGAPTELVFLPDCTCDEGEGDCAPPEWRVTE